MMHFGAGFCRNLTTVTFLLEREALRAKKLLSYGEILFVAYEKRLACFGNYAKKPYIPRVWRYFFDSLTFKGNTDQFRVQPDFSCSQERK